MSRVTLLKSLLLASAVGFLAPAAAFAHHSTAAYDLSKEVVIEGTVAELDWKNPHIYLTVETTSADGKPRLQQIEAVAISVAQTIGLRREAVAPGARVLVRANPNRLSPAGTMRGIDVTAADGAIYPLAVVGRSSVTTEAAVPAGGLAGKWASSRAARNDFIAAGTSWPFTEAARAAMAASQARPVITTLCEPLPPPLLTQFPQLRILTIGEKTATILYDYDGQDIVRTIHLDQTTHPQDLAPSLQGHSIGRWEGGTLVIDTVGFAPHPMGIYVGVPSSPAKHLVERLTLTDDRLHLRYEATLEDPMYLEKPIAYTALWDHRPDLEPSAETCDPAVARRSLSDE
jgi:hypothetical protein